MTSKNILFGSILALIGLTALELAAFSLHLMYDRFLSHGEGALKALKEQEANYSTFLASTYDGRTGWRNRTSVTEQETSCHGHPITAATDVNAARLNGPQPHDPRRVQIVTVGDSYTFGDDETDQNTYPAQLEQLTGAKVINHGVGGFGPLQATLRFEQIAPIYPNARIAVLGIMHENIRRMVNSYRPVLYKKSQAHFAFKPYVDVHDRHPEITPNPNGPTPKSFADIQALAKRAFDEDYWLRPKAQFPYSLNMLRSLATNNTQKTKGGGAALALGFNEFSIDYGDDEFQAGLELVIARFIASAQARDMKAVIAFIPQSIRDLSPSDILVDRLESLPAFEDAAFVRVGHSKADWATYKPNQMCHPSAAGYGIIAAAIHAAIADHGWLTE